MSEDMKDLIIAIVVAALLIVVLIALAFLLSYLSMQASCSEFASVNPEMEFKFVFWNGCLVKLPDGMWLSTSNMRWMNGKLEMEQLP